MQKTLGAALALLVLAGAETGVANAKTHPVLHHQASASATLADVAATEHVSLDQLTHVDQIEGPAVAPGTLLALDSAAQPVDQQPFTISPQDRARLRSMETASNMTAGGDVAMWSASQAKKQHAAVAKARNEQLNRFARGIISRTSSIAANLTRSAMRFIGTPYVFGGTSASGFDCSGYTQHVFAMVGISIPRTADVQYYAGRPTVGGMTAGDLVFFQTYLPGPSHVGIYLGGGKFVHASGHGVMVSNLSDSYWRARYIGAKRVALAH